MNFAGTGSYFGATGTMTRTVLLASVPGNCPPDAVGVCVKREFKLSYPSSSSSNSRQETSSDSSSSTSDGGLSTGAWVGIAGFIGLFFLFCTVAYYWYMKRSKENAQNVLLHENI